MPIGRPCRERCSRVVSWHNVGMDSPRRSRAETRAQMEAGVLREARRQLDSHGPAQLSLRKIARDLGVVSSAVYRYVSSRDELLTLLITDAFDELADRVDATWEPNSEPLERLNRLGAAMRTWAIENPARWGLIYGTPVPDYQAPVESTTPAGTRVMARLLEIAAEGRTADASNLTSGYEHFLREAAAQLESSATPRQMSAAVEAWALLIGTLNMEVFGHLGPGSAPHGPETLDRALATIATMLGLPRP